MSKKFFKLINLIYAVFILFQIGSFLVINNSGHPVKAANDSVPSWKLPVLQVSIPNIKFATPAQCGTFGGQPSFCVGWIVNIIQAYYSFALGAVGILAAIGVMIGGLLWLTAGGNAGQVTKAKDWIKGSLTGMILTFSIYGIFYVVNPEILKLKPIQVVGIEKKKIELDMPNPDTSVTPIAPGAPGHPIGGSSEYGKVIYNALIQAGFNPNAYSDPNQRALAMMDFMEKNYRMEYTNDSRRGTIVGNTMYYDCSSLAAIFSQCYGTKALNSSQDYVSSGKIISSAQDLSNLPDGSMIAKAGHVMAKVNGQIVDMYTPGKFRYRDISNTYNYYTKQGFKLYTL